MAALEAIAHGAAQVYSAETMPWHRLRQMVRIRSLLEVNYRPATANRMVAALRGVLRECWHQGLLSTDDYQAALSVKAVRGESEPRGRDLSAGELRSLFEACARAPRAVSHRQDSGARRRRDAGVAGDRLRVGVRRAEAIALDVGDVDFATGQLRFRQGKGKTPRLAPLAPSALPALEDWLGQGARAGASLLRRAQDRPPGPRRLRRPAPVQRSAAWAICKERGEKAGMQAPVPHDLRRTWVGDLLEFADLATVHRPCSESSVSAARPLRPT